jgi:hypothetical protein
MTKETEPITMRTRGLGGRNDIPVLPLLLPSDEAAADEEPELELGKYQYNFLSGATEPGH